MAEHANVFLDTALAFYRIHLINFLITNLLISTEFHFYYFPVITTSS